MKFRQAFRGFVRNLTEWAWAHEIETTAGIARIRKMHADAASGKAMVDMDIDPAAQEYILKVLASILVDCENYREAKLVVQGSGQEVVVTILKSTGKTPNEKRLEAEAEIAKQRTVIAGLEAQLKSLQEKPLHYVVDKHTEESKQHTPSYTGELWGD
jgi:hypothetical protein